MKTRLTNGTTVILSLAASILITSCAVGNPSKIRHAALGDGSEADPYIITIKFDSATSCTITGLTEDPAKCASDDGSGFCMKRNQSVQWESDPLGIKYSVYFHPFKGAPLKSNRKGVLTKKIDAHAPFSNYKYSILRDKCNSKTDTFDPHIRVNN